MNTTRIALIALSQLFLGVKLILRLDGARTVLAVVASMHTMDTTVVNFPDTRIVTFEEGNSILFLTATFGIEIKTN